MQQVLETLSQFGKVMGEAGPRQMSPSSIWQYPPAYSDVYLGTIPPLTYDLHRPPGL